jgi:hypothetical protein
MHRPTRQHQHLATKIASKQSRGPKKPGKKTKQWLKWAAQYAPLVAGAETSTSTES